MAKILGFNEDFVKKICEEEYVAHDQNGPKFQENIFDVALKGADSLAGNKQVIETLRKQFGTGAC